jgi:hypothetical protein
MNTLIARSKSRLDKVAVLLVLFQFLYCCWEFSTLHPKGVPWQIMLPVIAAYAIIIFVLPSYIRGQKWAWAVLFLFSTYVLHQTIIVKFYWHSGIEQSFAIVEIVTSALCLRILSSTAKGHSISRHEFAKVFGAIALAVAVIFIRGNCFPPNPGIVASGFSSWVSMETMSQITAWRMLLLLYASYAGILTIAFIAARYILTRSAQAHP